MLGRLTLATCLLVQATLAIDATGTWKLNAAKSKYTGVPAVKDMTVVYSPEGSGWRYQATGTAASGQAIKASFTYVKDGADIQTTGFPNWDAVVLSGANAAKTSIVFKRAGKEIGKGTRVISSDGKTMTIKAQITTPDSKKGSYVSIYEKQ